MKKRFNLRISEDLKEEVKKMALEINPDRPRVEDVLRIAVMIRESEPRVWRHYVLRLNALRGAAV
ncbi:MAG: hypothetical protein QXE50_05815 [Nitrososphaerota archaeon]